MRDRGRRRSSFALYDRAEDPDRGQSLGIAQKALTLALAHGNEREQFGRKVGQFQGLQFMYADLFTQIEAARSLVYRRLAVMMPSPPTLKGLPLSLGCLRPMWL